MSDVVKAPVAGSNPTTRWGILPWRFAVHAAVGTAMFVTVGCVALLLQGFIHALEHQGFPRWAVLCLAGVKWGLFLADLALFVIFVGRSFLHHAQVFLSAEVE